MTPKMTVAALGIPLLLAGSLGVPAAAAPQVAPAAAPLDCPAAMPVASVRSGMTGQGLTVVRGSTPQPFAVEVLGVMTNWVAPGKDLIMVEVSDLAGRHVIDQGDGIWAGMSGSPVYVGGKLLGAVSYGFTQSASRIGGVTPAADMVKLLTPGAAAASNTRARTKIPLSASTRARLAAQAGVAAPRGDLQRLPTPLSVSGLSSKRLDRLQSQTEAVGLPVVTYAGGSHSATVQKASARPQPGGNFAAALSYGDLTAAASGTTTAVCGQQALAFGHPFYTAGAVSYGANDGNSLAIVKSTTFGPFKMMNLGDSFGTVTQDRVSGISARLGAAPPGTPVTAAIRDWDSGRARTGTSRIVDQRLLPGLVPYALLAEYDAAFDEFGDGRASGTWTITGTRAGGKPFTFSRSNRWASREDLASEPANDVAVAVDALANNEFEPVTIDRVGFQSTYSTTFRQLRIVGAEVSVNGGKFTKARSLRVKAGAKLKVRVSLVPYRSSSTRTVTVSVKVPKNAKGRAGSLMVTGGGSMGDSMDEEDLMCLLSPTGCDSEPDASSLDAVMASITSAARNDDVVASLSLESPEGEGPSMTATGSARATAVISGTRQIALEVR